MLRGIAAEEITHRLTGLARNIYDAMVVRAAREMQALDPQARFECILRDKNGQFSNVAFASGESYVIIAVVGR